MEKLSTGTNTYVEQGIKKEHRSNKKIGVEWFSLTVEEMKAYFALCIIMSEIEKSDSKMYWSKRQTVHEPIFPQTMFLRR